MSTFPSLPKPVIDLLPHFPPATRAWLVGGAVRDILLGRKTYDFDFAIEGDSLKIARHVADAIGGAYFPLDHERGTGRIIHDPSGKERYTLDISCLRGGTIEADLRMRDFTANALAVELQPPYDWIDPMQGVKDIRDRVLRPCHTSAMRDDPVRSLRAIRLSIELSFRLARETIRQIRQTPALMRTTSIERVRDEVMLLLDMPRPGAGIRLLEHLGFLYGIFPELDALQKDHTHEGAAPAGIDYTFTLLDRLADLLAVLAEVHDPDRGGNVMIAQASLRLGRYRKQLVDHLNRSLSRGRRARQILFLAALYHRVGAVGEWTGAEEKGVQNASTAGASLIGARAHALRLSNAEADLAATIVRCRPSDEFGEGQIAHPKAVYRFYRCARDAGIETILIWLADYLAVSGPSISHPGWAGKLELARSLFQAYFEERDRLVDPTALINGTDLMEILKLDPGPQVGRYLELIREAQVAGEVTTREQAVAFIRSLSNHEHGTNIDHPAA